MVKELCNRCLSRLMVKRQVFGTQHLIELNHHALIAKNMILRVERRQNNTAPKLYSLGCDTRLSDRHTLGIPEDSCFIEDLSFACLAKPFDRHNLNVIWDVRNHTAQCLGLAR